MLTGVHFSCHLAKARKVVLLIEKMKSGTVTFTYVGQDGVERTVRGTLTRYEKDFKKPYRTNPDSWFIVYYNTEVEGWRAFQVTGIVVGGGKEEGEKKR
jgi:hypothetical protein